MVDSDCTKSTSKGEAMQFVGETTLTNINEKVQLLSESDSFIIVPEYGLAVSWAQYPLKEMVNVLRVRRYDLRSNPWRDVCRVNLTYCWPKWGYRIILLKNWRRSIINETDVVLVIGANDTVNSAAKDDPSSQFAGMPVICVWNAKQVIVMKPSLAAGYAGVDNPLFLKENASVLFGDAKDTVEKLSAGIKSKYH
jgi:NAD/NADP transhydrogenase beta subunit